MSEVILFFAWQLRDNPELFFVLPALTLVQKDGSDNVVHISGIEVHFRRRFHVLHITV
jgi:hypothetical protein